MVYIFFCPPINKDEKYGLHICLPPYQPGKCDRTSQVKNRPARTYNARTVPNPFRTHFRTHIARAEVRYYAHVRRNPTFKRIDHHIFFFLLMFKYFSAFTLESSRLDKYVALQFMLKTFSASEKNRPMSICAHFQ